MKKTLILIFVTAVFIVIGNAYPTVSTEIKPARNTKIGQPVVGWLKPPVPKTRPGDLDIFFGGDRTGLVITDMGGGGSADEEAYSMVVQNNGKIIIAGKSRKDGHEVFALARYCPDGLPDDGVNCEGTGFGTGGKVVTPFSYMHRVDFTDIPELLKIVPPGKDKSILEEFIPKENIDPQTGNPFYTVGVTVDAWGRSVIIQNDGRIIVVGGYRLSFELGALEFKEDRYHTGVALARYNSDGQLDASFGKGGKSMTELDDLFPSSISFNELDKTGDVGVQINKKIDVIIKQLIESPLKEGLSIGVLNDGRIVVGGPIYPVKKYKTERGVEIPEIYYNNNDYKEVADQREKNNERPLPFVCGLFRYCQNGKIDKDDCGLGGLSFGNDRNGIIKDFSCKGGAWENDRHNAMAITWDPVSQQNKILVLSHYDAKADSGISVARYCDNGVLDNGTQGFCGKPGFGIYEDGVGRSYFGDDVFDVSGLAVDKNGKILAIGTGSGQGGTYNFAIVRFCANGILDNSKNCGGWGFGSGGEVNLMFDGARYVNGTSVAIQCDGKIVAAGYTPSALVGSEKIVIARYCGHGLLDDGKNCGSPGFGKGGTVVTDLSKIYGLKNLRAHAVAIDKDCGILVAGSANKGADFMLARYKSGLEGDQCNAARSPGFYKPVEKKQPPTDSILVKPR